MRWSRERGACRVMLGAPAPYAIVRVVIGGETMRRIAAALLVAIVAASCVAPVSATTKPTPSAAVASPELDEQQQYEAGAVTVAATWISGTASARVTLDTHSVDLDGFDLKELAHVRLDAGAWVAPTLWDAPKGGHHRAGTLTFGSLDPATIAAARVVELEIRNVGVPSHLLRWERAR